ncbi:hypothetical protein R77567_01626 [Ralstonia sp. LMG 32965]|uniref:Bacteriophage-related protein n=1 Tax=Ralstonia flatus TaxID=3058601 RepID=A0AAD2BWB4_9RALS|nr:hypothetical protein R77567_01626 [Ralstonia sp. LMG 32965]
MGGITEGNLPDRMTVSGYAEYRGVSRRAVQFALADGRISKGSDGKIDRVSADIAWAKNTDASKPNTGPGGTAKETSQGSQGSQVGIRAAELVEGGNYMDNRAVREYHLARIAKVEADEAEGSVIDVEDVRAAWSKVANELKTRMLAIPSKAKSRIPHLSTDDVGVIDDLIREALGEVADCPMP